MPSLPKLNGTTISLVAVGAALIAASTLWGGLPVGGVNITLQTLAVLLVGATIGAYRGAAAVIVYLVVGSAGVPIFSGHSGGLAVWSTPRAGFLVAFVLGAFVAGWMAESLARSGKASFAGFLGATVIGGFAVIGILGWAYLGWRAGLTVNDTVAAAAPFVPGDAIKELLAASVAAAVHRAYPQILAGDASSAPATAITPAAPKAAAQKPVASKPAASKPAAKKPAAKS